MRLLSIDLSSYGGTSVCCLVDPCSEAPRFQRVPTTREALRAHVEATTPDLVVFEMCGVAHVVRQALIDGPWHILVASVNEEPWRWRVVKRKTDRDDALRLAKLALAGDIVPVHMPPEAVRQWRMLIRYRNRLVQRRTAIRNQIRSLLDREGVDWPKEWRGWTPAAMDQLRSMACPLDEICEDPHLYRIQLAIELEQLTAIEASIKLVEAHLRQRARRDERVALLQTIPGVGPRCAEALVAYIDDPSRFRTGAQIANSVGLTPRIFQSGDMERLTRISKRGNPLVRSLLVEVCWLGRQVNPWLQAVYDQVCRGSQARSKIAIIACARRLLIRAWAMLRDGTPWDPAHQPARP